MLHLTACNLALSSLVQNSVFLLLFSATISQTKSKLYINCCCRLY